MTKTKEASTTKRGATTQYFRDYFTSHPEQLQERGNSKVLNQYREDNDLEEEDEVPKKVISSLNNLKTALKKGNGQSVKKVKSVKALPLSSGTIISNGNVHNGFTGGSIPVAVMNYVKEARLAFDSIEKMFAS